MEPLALSMLQCPSVSRHASAPRERALSVKAVSPRRICCSAWLVATEANIDLAIHKLPFPRRSELRHEVLKIPAVFRCIFEPCQEVESFPKITTMMQSPGDGGKIHKADCNMVRLLLKDGSA